MTAKHYLKHLAKAYAFYHPLDEHKKFKESLKSFEKNHVKREISDKLDFMEKKTESILAERSSERLLKLRIKIRSLKEMINGS